MNKKAALLVVFSILLGCLRPSESLSFSFGSCVDSPVIPDFDVSKYLGVWYENERSNVFFENGLKCVYATYGALNSNTISVTNKAFNPDKNENRSITGNATVPDAKEPNKLLVVFPNSSRAGQYNVWTTDYKTYSVVYSCSQIIPYIFKLEMIWILARENKLDASVVSDLKNTLTLAGVDTESFEKTDQTNCKY